MYYKMLYILILTQVSAYAQQTSDDSIQGQGRIKGEMPEILNILILLLELFANLVIEIFDIPVVII